MSKIKLNPSIHDKVVFREGKNKWKTKYCFLNRSTKFADYLQLYILKNEDDFTALVSINSTSSVPEPVDNVYACFKGVHLENRNNVMLLICKSCVHCIAFDDFNMMGDWADVITSDLKDFSMVASLIHRDRRALENQEGCLSVHSNRICFVTGPGCSDGQQPKLLITWEIDQIAHYGINRPDTDREVNRDLGNYCIVGGPRCTKGKGRGMYLFECPNPEALHEQISSTISRRVIHSLSEMSVVGSSGSSGCGQRTFTGSSSSGDDDGSPPIPASIPSQSIYTVAENVPITITRRHTTNSALSIHPIVGFHCEEERRGKPTVGRNGSESRSPAPYFYSSRSSFTRQTSGNTESPQLSNNASPHVSQSTSPNTSSPLQMISPPPPIYETPLSNSPCQRYSPHTRSSSFNFTNNLPSNVRSFSPAMEELSWNPEKPTSAPITIAGSSRSGRPSRHHHSQLNSQFYGSPLLMDEQLENSSSQPSEDTISVFTRQTKAESDFNRTLTDGEPITSLIINPDDKNNREQFRRSESLNLFMEDSPGTIQKESMYGNKKLQFSGSLDKSDDSLNGCNIGGMNTEPFVSSPSNPNNARARCQNLFYQWMEDIPLPPSLNTKVVSDCCSVGQALPVCCCQGLPSSCQPFPDSCEALPGSCQVLSDSCQALPESPRSLSGSCLAMPGNYNNQDEETRHEDLRPAETENSSSDNQEHMVQSPSEEDGLNNLTSQLDSFTEFFTSVTSEAPTPANQKPSRHRPTSEIYVDSAGGNPPDQHSSVFNSSSFSSTGTNSALGSPCGHQLPTAVAWACPNGAQQVPGKLPPVQEVERNRLNRQSMPLPASDHFLSQHQPSYTPPPNNTDGLSYVRWNFFKETRSSNSDGVPGGGDQFTLDNETLADGEVFHVEEGQNGDGTFAEEEEACQYNQQHNSATWGGRRKKKSLRSRTTSGSGVDDDVDEMISGSPKQAINSSLLYRCASLEGPNSSTTTTTTSSSVNNIRKTTGNGNNTRSIGGLSSGAAPKNKPRSGREYVQRHRSLSCSITSKEETVTTNGGSNNEINSLYPISVSTDRIDDKFASCQGQYNMEQNLSNHTYVNMNFSGQPVAQLEPSSHSGVSSGLNPSRPYVNMKSPVVDTVSQNPNSNNLNYAVLQLSRNPPESSLPPSAAIIMRRSSSVLSHQTNQSHRSYRQDGPPLHPSALSFNSSNPLPNNYAHIDMNKTIALSELDNDTRTSNGPAVDNFSEREPINNTPIAGSSSTLSNNVSRKSWTKSFKGLSNAVRKDSSRKPSAASGLIPESVIS